MRRLWPVLLLCLAAAAFAEPPRAWVLTLDDQVVSAQAADRPLPPASLTKLMTALLWLDLIRDADPEVTISRRAAAAIGSRAGLRAGERYRGSELLAAMLVASDNDACLALAEHAAGSVGAFVAAMNRYARALDLRGTRFENPCGLDHPAHLSTARDLLKLAERVLAEPRLRVLFAQPSVSLAPLGGGKAKSRRNSNALLGRLDGAVGVKTGYTRRAGPCVIAYVERAGRRVLLVLLNAPDRWWTAHGMVERALAGNLPSPAHAAR